MKQILSFRAGAAASETGIEPTLPGNMLEPIPTRHVDSYAGRLFDSGAGELAPTERGNSSQ